MKLREERQEEEILQRQREEEERLEHERKEKEEARLRREQKEKERLEGEKKEQERKVQEEKERFERECKAREDFEEEGKKRQERLRKKQEEDKAILRREEGRNVWDNSKRIVEIKTTPFVKTKKEIEKSVFLGLGKKKELVETFTEKEIENQIEVRRNTIDMKFVRIEEGEFMMGSDGYGSVQPVHKVKISKPFYLGTYPVTQREWKAVMGENPSAFKGNDLPVERVSWNDVQEFIKKLNQKEGADMYRLPSEAEWEYACRAGTTTWYSFGDDESKLGDYAWYDSNSGRKTHPVGQKMPNPWGLYGMHGNVWEWVQDLYHSNCNGAPTDGSAWESGSGSGRVSRGGGWYLDARRCLSAYRGGGGDTVTRYDGLGFRLLRGA